MRLRAAAWHFFLVALPLTAVLLLLGAALDGDAAVQEFFRDHRRAHEGLKAFMRLVTDWGNIALYPVWAAILVAGWRQGDRRKVRLALTYLAVQLLISFLLVRGLKIAIGRPRPDVDGPFAPFSLDAGHHSLPSGHSTEMAGAVLPLAMWLRREWLSVLLGLALALVGFSRIYMGWHHVSDVAFGLALGGYAGWAIYAFGLHNDSQRTLHGRQDGQ
jgi:undecaprenyl-diphosphatase